MKKQIIIFGYGYVSKFLIQKLKPLGWAIYCTSRKVEVNNPIKDENVTLLNFLDPEIHAIIQSSSICLSTIPPNSKVIDPVLRLYAGAIAKAPCKWIGYLSSTSVYGDHGGAWVNEGTICSPSNAKSKVRFLAEKQWLDLYSAYKSPVHIFRLSGIYGPHRNCLEQIKNGKNFTIIKKGQYFSRIHVEDICMATTSSMNKPTPGEIYNLSDDEPAPLDTVQQFAASILNAGSLKEIPFEESSLSEAAKYFFADNKKVMSQKIKANLNIAWRYPSYKSGLLEGC